MTNQPEVMPAEMTPRWLSLYYCICFNFVISTLQPEMQAQCTLINFTVTKDGLEEQLLAEVVRCERPDLEELKVSQFRI